MEDGVLLQESTWRRSPCDVYIFLLTQGDALWHHADISHYHDTSSHDHHPHAYWNYHAYFILLLLPSPGNVMLRPEDVVMLYNFRKTEKVLMLLNHGEHVLVWTHRLCSRDSEVYLSKSRRYSTVNSSRAWLSSNKSKKPQLKLLDTWWQGKFRNNKNFFPTKCTNLEGTVLRVATFDHPPSVVYALDEQRNIVSRLGVDMQIVQTLAEARNFTIEFIEVSHDELWGFELPNGTWVGLVGKIYYEEADIGACNVFLEIHRWKQMDYSAPYNFERGCFVAPAPKPLANWQSPTMPFTWDTWAAIGVSLIIGGVLLNLVVVLSVNSESFEFQSFSYDYLYILGALTMRSVNLVPSRHPARVYVGFVWLCGFIIATAYSANLVAYLSVIQLSEPIDTMKHLSKSGLRLGGHAFWKTQFKASIDPTVRRFVNILETNINLNTLFNEVEAGKFALIENKQYLELQAESKYTYGKRSTIRIVPDCLLPYSIGLAFQKNSPLKPPFDGTILRLFESGMVQKWQKEVISYFRGLYASERSRGVANEEQRVNPLNLGHLQGVVYLLGLGYLGSFLIFVVEMIVNIKRLPVS